MDGTIISISSYGSHRVKHPHSGQMVSAYKMGYSSAASAVLRALYGDRARDVSSKQASYHYIQVDAEVTIRHGYILLKVTDDERTRAESLTIQTHRSEVYRWMDGAWHELPTIHCADYQPVIGHSGPNFNPTGMRIVSAATGAVEAAIAGIIVEKSQRSENDTPWHWIRGDTYPHREILKGWGCRWSKRQKAWYYMGGTLPDAIQQLIEAPYQPPDDKDDPCSIEEAAAVLGIPVRDDFLAKPVVMSDEPPRLFAMGEVVYARHDLETPTGQPIRTGAHGTITRVYNRNPTHGWSYDVDFNGIGTGWFFERELTRLETLPGIRVTYGSVIPLGGVQPRPDTEIKQALIEGGHQPEVAESDEDLASSSDSLVETVMDEPKIRIIKPVLEVSDDDEPDAVIAAIRQTKAESLPVLQVSSGTASGGRNMVHIPQAACGELTGSISGNVWCYGYALHDGVCVYINMGGPRTAVEAIRAKLSKGDIVSCVPWDVPAIELTAGEGNTGMYTAYMQNIPEAKFTHLILLHEWVVQPNYNGKSVTFILHVSDEQAMFQLRHHVTKLVKVPVFETWTGYLWQAGQSAMLVRKTRCQGGLDVLAVDLDVDSWTRLITGGLSTDVITLPTLA